MKNKGFIVGLIIILLLAWLVASVRPVELSVTFFDVGQGDAALITTPARQAILIDGGPDRSILDKIGRTLPWDKHMIDLMILSHPHADHLTGLVAVLRQYRVREILMTGVVHTTPEYLEFLKIIQTKKIPVRLAQVGQTIKLAQGVELEVAGPIVSYQDQSVADLNATSLVVKLKYGTTQALFTGDQTKENELELLKMGVNLSAQILKVSHHGSRASSSLEFLRAVKPDYAVISVGAGNSFGHPAAGTVQRLQALGAAIYRTDKAGDVEFISDGRSWRLP